MINIPEIETELQAVAKKPMTLANLQMFNQLSEAMRNAAHMNRQFTEEDARKWVERMEPPARWATEQTTALMRQKGYHHKEWEFWAVMNALNSDYHDTMVKYGADRTDLWADLAHDWLCDRDAVENKAGRYWRDIVRHE